MPQSGVSRLNRSKKRGHPKAYRAVLVPGTKSLLNRRNKNKK